MQGQAAIGNHAWATQGRDRMSIDELVKWTSLAMPLVLGVSTFIAIMVYRFTRRQAQMESLRLIHSRWQDINRVMIERPNVQRLLGDRRFSGKSDDEIIVYNCIFQILNVCYELHFARIRGLIDPMMADTFLAGNLDVLRGRRAELLDILDWNRAYDDAFKAIVRRQLAEDN
jgi:hypothetical protein